MSVKAEKNLKDHSENSSVLFCFHRNLCLRNGTKVGKLQVVTRRIDPCKLFVVCFLTV